MSEALRNGLLIGAGLYLAALVWAIMISYAYIDVKQRNLSGLERNFWLFLVSILPGVGLLIYLFFRRVAHFFSADYNEDPAISRGTTLAKRPLELDSSHSTIIGFEPVEAYPNPLSQQAPWTSPAQRLQDTAPVTRTSAFIARVLEGPHTGETYFVNGLPALIGRGADAAVRLDADLGVSRHHAELYEREGDLYLRDLSSSHGTEINGQRILDVRVRPGDQVRVGVSLFSIQNR